jgi:hypothetical protein
MMKHSEIDTGLLRTYLDGAVSTERSTMLDEHVKTCMDCQSELKVLAGHAASVRTGLDFLPQPAHADSSAVWSALRARMEPSAASRSIRWSPLRAWSFAGAGVVVVAAILVVTVAPIRGWAENLLAIFRVERFTVLEVNPDAMKAKFQSDDVFNQQIGHMLSQDVTVTEPPRKAELVSDVATASKLSGFHARLITGETPSALLLRNSIAAQMKLDRDRLQSILNEAGRNDLQIPPSLDGAVIGVHVPSGIVAMYGNCGDMAARWLGEKQAPADAPAQTGDATCIMLNELPSPTVSAPQQIDPAEIAQVALQFLGMSPNDAANFTQTVDWKTTFVLPVFHGISSYQKVQFNGNEAVLVRASGTQASGRFNLLWVDNGIVYSLMGTGDDTTAVNLGSKIE